MRAGAGRSLHRRTVSLEQALGYRQYTDRRTAKFLSATNATRVMVWGAVPLWLWAAIHG